MIIPRPKYSNGFIKRSPKNIIAARLSTRVDTPSHIPLTYSIFDPTRLLTRKYMTLPYHEIPNPRNGNAPFFQREITKDFDDG